MRWGPNGMAAIAAVLVTGGLALQARPAEGSPCVSITLASSEEKSALLSQMAGDFQHSKISLTGGCINLRVMRKASGEVEQALANGWDERTDGPRPDVWSPAAATWIVLLDQRLSDRSLPPVADSNSPSLFRSPLVIGMPRPMAIALGWPERSIGWSDFFKLAPDPTGWSSFGHPEWGPFKLGKTNPTVSTSGLHALVAAYFAASGKSADLKSSDLVDPAVVGPVRAVESSVVHYGNSVSNFLFNLQAADDQGKEQALSYVSAVSLEEKEVYDYNRGNPTGDPATYGQHLPPRVPLVAIYPREGSLAANHPYAILDAPWVTESKRAAAQAFLRYLQQPAQQRQFRAAGFRDQGGSPGSAIAPANGLLPDQPRAYLQPPEPLVLGQIQSSWASLRKRARILLLIDTTAATRGLDFARLQASIDTGLKQLASDDEVGAWSYAGGSTPTKEIVPVGPLMSTRAKLDLALAALTSSSQAGAPYRALDAAVAAMRSNADPARINAVILIGAGRSTDAAEIPIDSLVADLRSQSGPGVHVFTVAEGSNPARQVLHLIALAGRGAFYDASSPASVSLALAAAISNF